MFYLLVITSTLESGRHLLVVEQISDGGALEIHVVTIFLG